jgi:integration host factor subunit beta
MNKQDLISELSRLNGLSKPESKRVVELFFNAMAESLAQCNRVEIRGLCAFKVKEYDSYDGRNPKTGELVKEGWQRSCDKQPHP